MKSQKSKSADPATALLAKASRDWKKVAPLEHAPVLHLAILRDLFRKIHAARSTALAYENLKSAENLATIETQLQQIRDSWPQEKPAPVPMVLREKLARHDRRWESFIASEASGLGLEYWVIYASPPLETAEKFNRAIHKLLSPHAVVLFAETDAAPHTPPKAGHWSGCWWTLHNPRGPNGNISGAQSRPRSLNLSSAEKALRILLRWERIG